jgi:hypothetical protein
MQMVRKAPDDVSSASKGKQVKEWNGEKLMLLKGKQGGKD